MIDRQDFTKTLALGAAVVFLTLLRAGASENEIMQNVRVNIDGVVKANVSLNGTWKFTLTPADEFWKNDVDPSGWDDMPVPGDVFAQGFNIVYDSPFAYKRQIQIPADFRGQRIFLHFGAVHNLAKVWVNGQFVATHQGGFTPWQCDITDHVQPGISAWVAIGVTDLRREISFNGKAGRPIGGLTRSVELRARPETFFDLPIVSTPFDNEFRNATLEVVGRVTRPSKQATVWFRLFDPSGNDVALKSDQVRLDQEIVTFQAPVMNPIKWDAEHPNLYRLQITVKAPGQSPASYSRRIGFRDIRFDNQKNLLINGKIVKLRGANRHLCNPTGGKTPTAEYERLDVELAKETNLNFFRTSHYPPGERLLDCCDELGIYVTVESAVVDVGKSNRPSQGMQNDPKETRHFLSQLEEMVLNYGDHPSAIIWSLANESVYGINFLESYRHCKKLDPSRPVTASYQFITNIKHESYDIKSHHYPMWNENFADVELPTIYDEWMHVLGHTADEWFHDPKGRDYWGRSLDLAWSNLFPTNGSVGGAIWNYIDDVTYLPDPFKKATKGKQHFLKPEEVRIATPVGRGNVFGTARWGIIDEWRRKKPEFWNTKKAYSQVRLLARQVMTFEAGEPLELPVYNRFDHTDLSEITMRITYAGNSQSVNCSALPPHAKGALTLPAHDWQAGTQVQVEFFDQMKRLIDVYTVALGKQPLPAIPGPKGAVHIEKSAGPLQLAGTDCRFDIDPATGLFTSVTVKGNQFPFEGPYMHLFKLEEYLKTGVEKKKKRKKSNWQTVMYDAPEPSTWKLTHIETGKVNGIIRVNVSGTCGEVVAHYSYLIGANGRLDIKYTFDHIPVLDTPDKQRDRGGPLTLEAGIKFQTSEAFDELAWKRTGYWSYYPQGHLSAKEGRVPLFSQSKPEYRKHPDQPWELDVHDRFYQGVDVPEGKLMTNVARAAKLGIGEYSLIDTDSQTALTVYGNSKNTTGRFNQARDRKYYLYILDTLDYHLRWGNYSAEYRPKPQHSGIAKIGMHSVQESHEIGK